jgi:hypothetical protein
MKHDTLSIIANEAHASLVSFPATSLCHSRVGGNPKEKQKTAKKLKHFNF